MFNKIACTELARRQINAQSLPIFRVKVSPRAMQTRTLAIVKRSLSLLVSLVRPWRPIAMVI